jgi:hypothetical protein
MPMADGSKVKYGNAFSRASIRIIFVDEIVEFVGEFSYTHKLDKAFGYGTNRAQGPMKQSAGKYVPGGIKMKGFKGGVQKMRAKVSAMSFSGTSYGDVHLPIHVQAIEANEDPIDLQFDGCCWEEESSTIADNADPLQDELSFTFFGMLTNGLSLNDRSDEL